MQDGNAQASTSTTRNMVNGRNGVGSLCGVVERPEEAEIEGDDEDPKSTSSEPVPATGGFFASLFKL